MLSFNWMRGHPGPWISSPPPKPKLGQYLCKLRIVVKINYNVICSHLHTHTHTHTHAHTHSCTHTLMHTHMHTHSLTHSCTRMHLNTHLTRLLQPNNCHQQCYAVSQFSWNSCQPPADSCPAACQCSQSHVHHAAAGSCLSTDHADSAHSTEQQC